MRRIPAYVSLVAAAGIALAGCSNGNTEGNYGGGQAPSQAAEPPPVSAPAVGSGGAASTPAAPQTSAPANVVGDLTIKGGQPEGGVQRISTKAGQPAVLLVTSDAATEVHVHGVDRTVQVPANAPTPVDVSQPASGSYEVEDHTSDALLVQLRVS